ncbi:hypothetical protein PVAP13_9KG282213 [Panicum virgatum]|uniref:Uncharacterized protein n=1 Tax=Panicum virgatum TaxID=38727 RepID=A0A8T0NKW1_PANVG|nr:hypothetical protein PVAP13_9KG282213 [Panicum virgatum]
MLAPTELAGRMLRQPRTRTPRAQAVPHLGYASPTHHLLVVSGCRPRCYTRSHHHHGAPASDQPGHQPRLALASLDREPKPTPQLGIIFTGRCVGPTTTSVANWAAHRTV